jgi:hypothetical protein
MQKAAFAKAPAGKEKWPAACFRMNRDHWV